MRTKITIGVLILALGGTLSVGFVAADGDLLNGPTDETVEPDGELIVDAEYNQSGTDEVVVSSAEEITVDTGDGTNATIASGTEIFTAQNRTLEGTSGYLTDTVTIDVTGSNITESVDGILTQDSFNVSVELRDAANSTLNSTTVSVNDPGILGGIGFGDGENTQRNLLIGGILLVAGYLYIRDD